MKAIMVMYDSLNRHMLPNYGCDWTVAPNFKRLGERVVTFDNTYVGSMPCMPARRELHTGRYNFLHRSWGPFEPFDDSAPEILRKNNIHTHLASDHYHYWEDGGATYHHRYSTWENFRGHEWDRWKGEVKDPEEPEHLGRWNRQNWINRKHMQEEEKTPQAQTFAAGMEFIRTNQQQDDWFVQIETFDPHEPFFTLNKWKGHYPHAWDGPHFDWPKYERVTQNSEAVQHVNYEYAALLTQCDHYLGKVIDLMDELDLWKDTMLIVNTDHGFLLGEHDWWAKNVMPFYNEVAHIPLFVWDPRTQIKAERRQSLVQMIDMGPTLLDFFNIEIPENMQGRPLKDVILSDTANHQAILYGIFGGHVNITDGRYVYMRGPQGDNTPLNHYTHMPAHMNSLFSPNEMKHMELHPGFSFTKECPVMKIPSLGSKNFQDLTTKFFDLENDPGQNNEINNPQEEKRMLEMMVDLMRKTDSPPEQFERLGIN